MKTRLLYLLLFISSFAFAQFPFNGLQAQYGFDSGSLFVDGANGINLTQNGTSLIEINDRFGSSPTSAITLNGDFLNRTDIDYGITGPSNNQQIYTTLSFWIKTSENSATPQVIFDDTDRTSIAETDWYGYEVSLKNGQLHLSIGYQLRNFLNNVQFEDRSLEIIAPTTISDDAWHHVVAYIKYSRFFTSTYNVQHTLELYIDGSLAANDFSNDVGTWPLTINMTSTQALELAIMLMAIILRSINFLEVLMIYLFMIGN